MVLALAVLFIALGFWQLDRLQERQHANLVNEERLSAEPRPVEQMIDATGDDISSLELRRGEATGRYVPEEQVLLRSQVRDGQPGYEAITPLLLDSGKAILVNRGWVPLQMGDDDPSEFAPDDGTVTIIAPLRASQQRGATSRDEPPGELEVVSRVDVDRIGEQIDVELLPVYLEIQGSDDGSVPVPETPPDTTNEGPHLNYAIQWFAFALIGALGYGFLIRRALRRAG